METIENSRRDSVNALKDLAYRAGYWTSFDPERLGESLLNECERELQAYENRLPDELRKHFEERYIGFYRDWLIAKSRCFSAAITGPAKFNVARSEKMYGYQRSARERMDQWAENFVKKVNREKRLKGWDEIARLKDKVESLENMQETMKATNAIFRSKKTDEEKRDELAGLGLSEKTIEGLFKPVASYYRQGFQSFELTNNLAKIKATKERLERLTKMQEDGDSETEINGVRMVICAEEERVRLYFDGKPAPDVISELKKSAFKWSPKNMAWQRQLTDNAIYAAKRILSNIGK